MSALPTATVTALIRIRNAVPRIAEWRFAQPVNWSLEENRQWAIIGPTGAGKTILTGVIQGNVALREGTVERNVPVRRITFRDIYSLADCRNAYYQQRWHATETGDIPTAGMLLPAATVHRTLQLPALFGLDALLSKPIICLSGGELRKFLIVRALYTQPRVLIIDNPFIGLDASARHMLVETLQQMIQLRKLQIVLVVSDPADIPAMITHVLPVMDKHCLEPQTRDAFLQNAVLLAQLFPPAGSEPLTLPASNKPPATHALTLQMKNVTIRYGQRTILPQVNWEVKNGEKWALTGKNGSGKSTLLSLVYADNPQAYANAIYLFDRKRGNGESIWDIKRRIGYVSPEMHLYYNADIPASRIAGSGFFDSVGLHRTCTPAQEATAREWLDAFDAGHLHDRRFHSLSSGEQRLVLLARAFVKDPDLLILDEPLHGLDCRHKQRVTRIIEQFCARPGKTLIYVTHYPHELPSCIDRMFQLN
jgi:molybdate transport system ATP-binding protein